MPVLELDRAQASDKEAFLARFVAVERALKEAIQQQLAAEQALDGKMTAHTASLKQLVARVEERTRGAESVLREQVEAAMGRLRAYAREVEEALDQVRSNPAITPAITGPFRRLPERPATMADRAAGAGTGADHSRRHVL